MDAKKVSPSCGKGLSQDAVSEEREALLSYGILFLFDKLLIMPNNLGALAMWTDRPCVPGARHSGDYYICRLPYARSSAPLQQRL